MRRGSVLAVSVVLLVAAFGAIPAAARAVPKVEHCTLEVLGQNRNGSYVTGPLECRVAPPTSRGRISALTTYIAVHFDNYNATGASLSIVGGSCNGGWLDLPAAWQDRVASTRSGCLVRHYRDIGLAGPFNPTVSPGGNLTTVAFQVSSVSYN